MPCAPPTVLIIGAGFSGTATAVQLLRGAQAPLQVLLLNESGRMARGLAYGTDSLDHVLNVPAGNMSALADDPDNFLRYGRWVDARWHAGSFVPRRLYGAYLESLLAAAESAAGPQGARLQRLVGRATHVQPPDPKAGRAGAEVLLEDGRVLQAEHVVLAFGHVAPEHPLDEAQRALLGTAYTADPWRQPISERVQPEDRVLLVGAGLTALDMLISLHRAGHRGPVHMLSRRGLAPQPHRNQDAAPGHPAGPASPASPDAAAVQALLQNMGPALRHQLRTLREAVAAAMAAGGDWRDWIAALRPHTRAWWQALSPADQRRFLRHLQPHWDSLRHRCAPSAHAVFEQWRGEARLSVEAGRIQSLQRAPRGGYTLTLRPRGSTVLQERGVDHIVNCTSPSGRLARSPSALVAALLAQGLMQPDALELGLQVDAQGRVIGRDGAAAPWLHYVGPLLKARDWEATAIPELRQHAAALAQRLLQAIGEQREAGRRWTA